MNKKLLTAFLSVLGTFSLLCGPAYALANSFTVEGLTTSPISDDLSVKPGTTVRTTLKVENNNQAPEEIDLKVDKFSAGDHSGHPKIYPPTPGDPSINWVHFDKTKFIAQPHTWTPVTMTISLPSSASLGYYYAVLFTPKTSISAKAKNDTTTFKGSNAVLILVDTHSSNEVKSLQIAKFTSSRSVYQYLPATFNIEIKNPGNIHLIPQGDIYISRSANNTNTLATLDINPGAGNVLPGSERVFSATWSNGFPEYTPKQVNGQKVTDKNGKVEYSLNWNLNNISKFRFGKYYAHLVMIYSDGNREIPVQAEVSFWVIPWTLIIVGLIILLVLGFGLYAIFRSVYTRIKKSKQTEADKASATRQDKTSMPKT